MLTLLVLLAVLAVLFVAAVVATQDRDLLQEAPPDDADVELPDGRVVAEDLRSVRFGMVFRGYRMSQVDDVLDRLAQELAERDRRIVELEQGLAEAVEPLVAEVEHERAGATSTAPVGWPEDDGADASPPAEVEPAPRDAGFAADLATSFALGSPAAEVPLPEPVAEAPVAPPAEEATPSAPSEAHEEREDAAGSHLDLAALYRLGAPGHAPAPAEEDEPARVVTPPPAEPEPAWHAGPDPEPDPALGPAWEPEPAAVAEPAEPRWPLSPEPVVEPEHEPAAHEAPPPHPDPVGDALLPHAVDPQHGEAATPATEPPATEPPATEPPTTEPPATEPPTTEPPPRFPPWHGEPVEDGLEFPQIPAAEVADEGAGEPGVAQESTNPWDDEARRDGDEPPT